MGRTGPAGQTDRLPAEADQCSDLDGLKAVTLNYGNKKNLLTRSVRDKIRRIGDGLYLGRYYNVIDENYVFRGYFSLEKKERK